MGPVSVIIPAHNEAKVLPRTLRCLLNQDYAGPLRIIVAANGCTDDTIAVAQSWEPEARQRGRELLVVEAAKASKPAALNAGDAAAGDGIRIYLDADMEFSTNTLSAVAQRLRPGTGSHLCAPALRIAPPESLLTRSYSRVWRALPYVRDAVSGRGFYGLSAEGRQRWGEFPTIVADDRFVRLHFSPQETAIADDAWIVRYLPEGLTELVKTRCRVYRGNREIEEKYPDLSCRDADRHQALPRFLLTHPRLWIDCPAFLLVFLLAKIAAWRERKTGLGRWERAERV